MDRIEQQVSMIMTKKWSLNDFFGRFYALKSTAMSSVHGGGGAREEVPADHNNNNMTRNDVRRSWKISGTLPRQVNCILIENSPLKKVEELLF